MRKYPSTLVLLAAVLFTSGCMKFLPSSGTTLYTNDQYSFSLEYPGNWNLYDGTKGESEYFSGVIITPVSEDYLFNQADGAYLGIDVNPQYKSTPREYIDKLINNSKGIQTLNPNIVISENEIILDGKINAIQSSQENYNLKSFDVTSQESAVNGNLVNIVFSKDGVFYSIIYRYPVEDVEKYKDSFESIVSSIKFQ